MKLNTAEPTVDIPTINAFLEANHGDPFAVLGMHQAGEQLTVRIFRPEARTVVVRDLGQAGREFPALQLHPGGFFEAVLDGAEERFRYELKFTGYDGHEWSERDPYSFGQLLGPLDLHLFAEGNHFEIYKKLGAHLQEIDGARGTTFHVWAPNAQRVSVVGDFNGWDGRRHPMR
ncbi:MAG TPA: 1,4-alpha-glucan branching enzyme, partial [Chthoniobacteraceae bacterium]